MISKKKLKSKKRNLKQSTEFKINFRYMMKFQSYKTKLENQLKSDYDLKKEELERELKGLKTNAYRQKCSEKLKMAQINKMKQSLDQKDRMLNSNSEKIDRALNESKIKGNYNQLKMII